MRAAPLPATQTQEWAAANELKPLELSSREVGAVGCAQRLQRAVLGLRLPDLRYWLAPPDSPLLATVPASAVAWSCCLQPGLAREVVVVADQLSRLRNGSCAAAEVARIVVHESTHAAVWAAAQPSMAPAPWPALVANVFEFTAVLIDCYCYLALLRRREPTLDMISARLFERGQLQASALLAHLEHQGEPAERLRASATLALALLTTEAPAARAAALNRYLCGSRDWRGWEEWLKILAWPSEWAAAITDLKVSPRYGNGSRPQRPRANESA
jgi:hypothetical protein